MTISTSKVNTPKVNTPKVNTPKVNTPKVNLEKPVFYPEADGKPVAESDITRDYLLHTVFILGWYFATHDRPEVYVSGNLFIYYEQGNPKAVLAPDVFVIFGVGNQKRRIYKAWEEGNKLPDFVMEVTSATTKRIDEKSKPIQYAELGVQEYFQYDPSGDYLKPQLKGRTLVNGVYESIAPTTLPDGTVSIFSQVLGLEVRLEAGKMYFFVPQTGQRLPTYQETFDSGVQMKLELEQAELERQQVELARQQAESNLQQAELVRQQVEADLQQAELARQEAELVRQQVEADLQQAELARQQLEADRHQAELIRQQIESELQQSELERQQAELARQQAESELQQVELARRQAIHQLLGMGLTPVQVATALSLSLEEVIEQS